MRSLVIAECRKSRSRHSGGCAQAAAGLWGELRRPLGHLSAPAGPCRSSIGRARACKYAGDNLGNLSISLSVSAARGMESCIDLATWQYLTCWLYMDLAPCAGPWFSEALVARGSHSLPCTASKYCHISQLRFTAGRGQSMHCLITENLDALS